MKEIYQKILCFFGCHNYKTALYTGRGGKAFGDRCIRCGLWGKNSIRTPWSKIPREER